MLVELLSTSNYVSFNIKLANTLGLHESIYLAEIINIYEKAFNKNVVDNDFIILDRGYVQKRTTLTDKEQIAIDKTLSKVGIITADATNENKIKIDLSILTSIVMTEDESLVGDISKIVKKKDKKSKVESAIERCVNLITTSNNELRKAYQDWIISATDKRGLMPNTAIITAQNVIDKYSNHNLDVALEVITIATINGWVDMTWAVNSYERNKSTIKNTYRINTLTLREENKKIELSEEEF